MENKVKIGCRLVRIGGILLLISGIIILCMLGLAMVATMVAYSETMFKSLGRSNHWPIVIWGIANLFVGGIVLHHNRVNKNIPLWRGRAVFTISILQILFIIGMWVVAVVKVRTFGN